MKVNRILKPSEVDEMVRAAGREPQRREAGAVTDEQIEQLNRDLGLQGEDRQSNVVGKKIPSSQGRTSQFSTDSPSDGPVRSAHRSPTDTPGVAFDDAKVRKITSKATNNIKKFKNGDIPIDTRDVNKMLARVRQLLGMSYKGRSNYGVYDTPKGRFAFRLTEHNAFGDNFAQDNAPQNVSVYIAINEYDVPDSQIPYKEYKNRS